MADTFIPSFQMQQASTQQSYEELSLLLSLKDHLLPQLSDPSSLSSFIQLLSDVFPDGDIASILAHEEQTRQGLLDRSAEDSEAGVSARESRAASAMMVVREEARRPSEGMYVHTYMYILYACILCPYMYVLHFLSTCALYRLCYIRDVYILVHVIKTGRMHTNL